MSGQTLTDRIAAAQYQLTGSEVSRAVCKATTHEVMAPKKKHLEYLISATNATNVNIPQMADTLFERATNASWIVVFKALVTTHHMCVHGNERFIQYLASRTALFNLSNFIDKTGSHGYDMSTFIRRYGRYLNERAFAYRQMAFDFTKVKKGAEGVMRTMAPDKLLKGMPVLQTQIDTLLEFDVHPKELNNPIINAAFLLLFKDLVKLFASYNDGVINLLEKYFKMKKSDCKEALEIYKRFLTRVTKIGEFMKLAETVGVEKNDIPDINYAPSSILESLETHMNSLEGKKGEGSPTKGSPTNNVSPTSTPAKSAAAVPTLVPPPEEATDSLLDLDPLSSSGPSAGASAAPMSWGDLLGSEMGESMLPDPTLAVDTAPSPAGVTPTPVAAEPGVTLAPPPSAAATTSSGATNMDLLGDAFSTPAPASDASAEGGAPAPTPTPAADAAADPFAPTGSSSNAVGPGLDLFAMMPMENNCFNSVAPPPAPSSTIAAPIPPTTPSIDLFSAMFDSMPDPSLTKADPAPSGDMFGADAFSSPAPFLSSDPPTDKGAIMDMFGDSTSGETQPAAPAAASGAELMAAFDGLGDVLMPAMTPQTGAASSPVKHMGGDLDATMANMASNLGMGSQKTGENTMGSGGWSTPQVAPPSWGAPMNVPMGSPSFMGSYQGFSMGGAAGAGAPMMPMVRPGFGAPAAPGAPMGSPGMAGSPRRPPPPKNALDDLNIKDFM
ncbi:clathrin coat assembly protein AP180 isoform X1 [Oncorhynchus tshawytscha]|uniref:clathrin coat assembly protein AP180 isoform X1 n=1 Tax=Oncorhynchus tshawytscha TaxID=74940 RepID=UPI000D0A08BC|nr:clathrin coat assembly protein AP180 isoform X1 [Oncorhynchus tshawytscha]XP_024276272.1 clathrin coat assembly protein AP180 isoform X1 [Oncorhynchus tshawytscha]